MTEINKMLLEENIIEKIYHFRGHKVMLDSDLAELYTVETKQLKRQVKRNLLRFPGDFMFELNDDEQKILRSQFGTLGHGGDYSKSGHLFFVKVATFFGLNCSLFSLQNGHLADFKRF